MKSEDVLKQTKKMETDFERMLKSEVVVGLPKETATAIVYETGESVVEIGAKHEFGIGVPMRSFLRVPFTIKVNEINEYRNSLINEVFVGALDMPTALSLFGEFVMGISQGSWGSDGYSHWKPLATSTIDKKKSDAILVDKGILKSSISYEIREHKYNSVH